MTSDPRRSTRQQILLGPPHEDAMDEDDEDELFGDNEVSLAMPQAVTHQLLNTFITPSPFPHHTSGPTSSRFRNAFTRITTNIEDYTICKGKGTKKNGQYTNAKHQ